MGYTEGTINYTVNDTAGGVLVTAYSSAACVQCYVNGALVGSKVSSGDGVTFRIDLPREGEYIRLLEVDEADRYEDYFADAFPDDAGPRITVKTPTVPGYFYDELWRVYLDDSLVHERDIWNPRTRRLGGWGTNWGFCWGVENYGSGWGNWWGLQWGYEPVTLEYETDILACGSYKLEVATVDLAGNESTQIDETVTLDTYPAPITDLAITSYTLGTDTLVLSFTGSTDIE